MPADTLQNRLNDWRARVLEPLLARSGLRRSSFATASGIPLPHLHTPADLAGHEYVRDVGFPGEYPFVRGVQPSMYRGRLWTMRQYAGYASAEETNARFRYLLEQGQTGLSVAFDLPTQLGYDPDHPLAAGEVGKVGVSIASLSDMEALFAGIPLDQVSTSMTINATAPVLLALYVALARSRGVDTAQLRGTTQNDILKEYVARGTHIFPPAPSLRLITDTLGYVAEHMPRWNPISISGYHMREAGATAVQEIAFTLANAIEYVSAAIEQGLAPDDFMPRLSFFFAAQSDVLEEIAKFRAARRVWARIARDRFGATDPRSMMLRFHAQTAGVSLTAQQPLNNVIRVTLQALAAVLGGTQSLHTNSMDEALGLPTREAATVALRTQQILAYESGLADTVDPLAGSYTVEALTDALDRAASALIATVDEMGGALAAIESGWVASQIAESAYRIQQRVETGDQTVVGVNRFADQSAAPPPRLVRIDAQLEERRRAQVAGWRSMRDAAAVAAALKAVQAAARSADNLMPAIIRAVESQATSGEICDTLRAEFGEFRPPQVL